jgi:hypothetical protein
MTEPKKIVKKERIKVGTVKHYEFIPLDNISLTEIKELSDLVRIGIAFDTYEKTSSSLRKHFREIK